MRMCELGVVNNAPIRTNERNVCRTVFRYVNTVPALATSGAGRAFGKVEVDRCQARYIDSNRHELRRRIWQRRNARRRHRSAGTGAAASTRTTFSIGVMMGLHMIGRVVVGSDCANGIRGVNGRVRCWRRRWRAQQLGHRRKALERHCEQHQPEDQGFNSRIHEWILA